MSRKKMEFLLVLHFVYGSQYDENPCFICVMDVAGCDARLLALRSRFGEEGPALEA